MRGSVFKRCGCTEVVDGRRKQLGARCPKLRRKDGTWNPRHGVWYYLISVPTPGGGRRRKPQGGYATEAEALQALNAARDRIRRGVSVDDPFVEDYLVSWLASKLDVRRSTMYGYRAHINVHWRPKIGHLRLSELRAAHVAEVLAEVPGSDANRQRVRATLRSALGDAVREGLVLVNVAALVKLPSGKRPKALVWTDDRVRRWRDGDEPPPSPVMVWTPAQLGTFLDHAHTDRLYALWHLIAHRGLRRGEAVGLRWSDVDLDAGTLAVSTQLVLDGWTVYEDSPKSDAGARVIALDAGTVAALREHRRQQLEDRLAWGAGWVDTGRVFVREDGSQIHPAWVTDRFVALVESAGLPPIRLHDLRHGAASLMLAAGVDMKVVQETLGHSMMAITADTYTSVYPVVAAEAAEAAAALVPRRTVGGTDVTTLSSHKASSGDHAKRKRR